MCVSVSPSASVWSVCLSACHCLLSLVLVLSSRSMSDPPLEDQAV